MRVLYVIFVLCVGALLISAVAAARHIRRHEEKRKTSQQEEGLSASQPPAKPKILSAVRKLRGDQ